MMDKKPILIEQMRGSTLLIIINRENKLNALNHEILRELQGAIANALRNTNIRGIILTGAGSKAFVAGADISEFANYTVEEGHALAKEGQTKVFDLIYHASKPIIAAINGFALGGGLELALACHIRIASDTAQMGLPEVALGLIPGYGGTQRLTQLIGRGSALEMILTGEMIGAQRAHSLGLVNHVVPSEELISTAEAFLTTLSKRSARAIGAAIRAVNASLEKKENGFEVEMNEFSACFGTPDFKEGVSAFLEKRSPKFSS